MATKKKSTARKPARKTKKTVRAGWLARLRRWALRAALAVVAILSLWILLYSVVPVYATPYMLAERARYGELAHKWIPIEEVAPAMARSVVAAEDANFCAHWGFDMSAIRDAIAQGGRRGGSTISQQVVKNAFLWQGRSWPRKALEASITPVVELVWSKQRILEIYLNVAEFDIGVFGIQAAARHYYDLDAVDLSRRQAARLAVLLPNPKDRRPDRLSPALQRRAAQIADGAETIRRDGRADCFED